MRFFIYLMMICTIYVPGHAFAGSPDPVKHHEHTDQLLRSLHAAEPAEVFVVAHRGVWRDFPENSIAAIKQAEKLGVQMVEIDIRATKDGRLVLMHDKTLERTTTGRGRVDQHTLAEIQKLHLLNGYGIPTEQRVPTLREALRATAGRMLVYLDKSYGYIAQAHAIAKSLNVEEQVFFYGYVTAEQLRADYPAIHKELNYLPKLKPGLKDRRAYIEGFLKRDRSPAFVVSFKEDDPAFFDDLAWIKRSGKRIWASPLWLGMCGDRTDDRATKDPDANWGWLIEQGFSMICTDRPRELLGYLGERERREAAAAQADP